MPKSSKFPIADVLAACNAYVRENSAEFTIEYILLKDVNDRSEHARALGELLRGARLPYLPKINLIPQNPVPGIALTGSTHTIVEEEGEGEDGEPEREVGGAVTGALDQDPAEGDQGQLSGVDAEEHAGQNASAVPYIPARDQHGHGQRAGSGEADAHHAAIG